MLTMIVAQRHARMWNTARNGASRAIANREMRARTVILAQNSSSILRSTNPPSVTTCSRLATVRAASSALSRMLTVSVHSSIVRKSLIIYFVSSIILCIYGDRYVEFTYASTWLFRDCLRHGHKTIRRSLLDAASANTVISRSFTRESFSRFTFGIHVESRLDKC